MIYWWTHLHFWLFPPRPPDDRWLFAHIPLRLQIYTFSVHFYTSLYVLYAFWLHIFRLSLVRFCIYVFFCSCSHLFYMYFVPGNNSWSEQGTIRLHNHYEQWEIFCSWILSKVWLASILERLQPGLVLRWFDVGLACKLGNGSRCCQK